MRRFEGGNEGEGLGGLGISGAVKAFGGVWDGFRDCGWDGALTTRS